MQRAPIEVGSHVGWRVKIHPELDYEGVIDASVTQLHSDGTATIGVCTSMVINSPVKFFTVSLDVLENKSWITTPEERQASIDKKRAAAQVVEESMTEGPYFDPHDLENVYYDSADYIEWCEENEVEPSEFLWCGKVEPLRRSSADLLVDGIVEQCEDDYNPEIKGGAELQAALDKFYEANSHIQFIVPDYSRCILVNKL